MALTTIETTFNEKGGDCAQQENSGQSSYWQLPPPLHSDANSRALGAPMQSKTSESRRIVVALIFRNSLRVLIISPAGPTQFGSIFFSFRFFDVKNRSPPLLCPDVRHSTNQWKYKYNLIGWHGNEWMLVGHIQNVVFHLISQSFSYLCLREPVKNYLADFVR